MTICTLAGLKDYLERDGWILNHTSSDSDGAHSYYMSKFGDLVNKSEIRLSDHPLGRKQGEKQGQRWAINIIVDPMLSLEDHVAAIANDEYRSGGGGFAEGYSYAEWMNAQGV